jgi:molybdopterin-containing oxidoreductase family membrane subunit
MFWIGQVFIGGILPLFLIYSPAFEKSRWAVAFASFAVLLGGFFQIYVIVIGGQAFPMNIFPGKEVVDSSFFGAQAAGYMPTFAEILLGISGIALALTMVAVGARVFKVFPESLGD